MDNKCLWPWLMVLLLPLTGCDPKSAVSSPPATPAAPVRTSAPAVPATDVIPAAPVTPASSALPEAGGPATLTSLVAPIALFPDPLLAQVLAASSQPDDIVPACGWLLQHKALTGDALRRAVAAQAWSPAVKALSGFPDVLAQMAENLPWTQALGAAYRHSPEAVMDAVQRLRKRAADNGALKSTPQQTVTTTARAPVATAPKATGAPAVAEPRQTITILPASSEVVYVPVYSSAVYGAPPVVYSPDYAYSTGEMVATRLISFTAGVVLGATAGNNNHWGPWGMRWGPSSVVVYNHRTFVNRPVVFRPSPHRAATYLAPGPVHIPHFSPLRNNGGAVRDAGGVRHPLLPAPGFSPHAEPRLHNINGPALRTDNHPALQRAPGPVRRAAGQGELLRPEEPLRSGREHITHLISER